MRKFDGAYLLLIIFSFLVPHQAGGEESHSISGTVWQKGEKRAIPGISVYIESDDDISTTTDEKGNFTLPLPGKGEYSVFAVGIGYKKPDAVKVKIEAGTVMPGALNIYLLPEKFTMQEYIVRGERNKERISKTVITGRTLERVPGTSGDPLKAIQALPGISSGNDASGSPAIRGSSPQDNLYYVDFLPVSYLFHMGGLVSVFNADLVDDFNLFASAFGPEYGDGLGAVIDVKLREPRKDRFGTKLQMSLFESDVVVEGPVKENQSFLLSARRSYMDLVIPKSMLGNEDAEITTFPQYWDYQGKYLWKISNDTDLSFQVNGSNDKLAIQLKPGSDMAQMQPEMVGEFSMTNGYHSQGVVITSRLSPTFVNKSAISHIRIGSTQNVAKIGNATFTEDYYLAKERLVWTPNERHSAMADLELAYDVVDLAFAAKFKSQNQFDPNFDPHTIDKREFSGVIYSKYYALALKDRWKITDKMILIPGIRNTHNTYLEDSFAEPKLGIEYDLTDSTLLTAGWGKYHQMPGGNNMIDGLGNPDINSLKGEHTVLGIEQKMENGWSVKSEIYYKTFSEVIVPDTDPNPLTNKNVINGGSGTSKGIEMLIKKNETENWEGWIALSYLRSDRTNDYTGTKINFDYDQPVMLNFVYSYNFRNGWEFGARWAYQSGQPFTPVIGTCTAADGLTCTTPDDTRMRPIYGEVNSERLPDYHRLDLRFDRDWIYDTWKLGLFFEFINAYNKENIAGYQYNPDYTEKTPIPQLPFMPGFGLKAEF
ncbi:MAG: TonB-dependent receptor [Nitrospinota bacterium]|nr:TonB-dependent receptor [Nitrospinota bacterium]